MQTTAKIEKLTKDRFKEAVNLVLKAGLDTRIEIEHHLHHFEVHHIALKNNKVIGVIGWYQDNVNYATEAMGDKFPGEKAFWVGFFVVDKNYQGQGVGSLLLQTIEKDVKGRGADSLWVSSVPETRSYYEKQGFKVVMEGKISRNPKVFLLKHL